MFQSGLILRRNGMHNHKASKDEICYGVTSVAPVSDDERYGGIEQEYVVKGCKVTVYNDGPVKMVDVKTDQPCDAPLPKGHKFSKKNH
ncbi:hypothetical protein B9X83_02265 [Acinetobacter nosocomialis]|nr:hypothetical protein B9X83_02265 [Acinetobacter nosocomialis]